MRIILLLQTGLKEVSHLSHFAVAAADHAPCVRARAHPMLDALRQYLVQARQEVAARLVEKLYADGTGKPSKWWTCFTKRRFMNRSLGN